MTADIVNLRRVRKAKARTAREQQAEANRLKFGRPRVERELDRKKNDLEKRRLDGAKVAAGQSDASAGEPTIDPAPRTR